MNPAQILQKIEQGRVIAILRGDFGGREMEIVVAVFEGGITEHLGQISTRAKAFVKAMTSSK